MSVDLIVYLPRSSMPLPEQWANGIREAGFPVDLDADFNVDTFTGFLPCRLEKKPSGFEYFSNVLSRQEQAELNAPQGCDFCVTLVAHSDMLECATSTIAAGILCQLSGGILFDPQSGDSYTADTALKWVREQLAEIEGG